MCLEATFVQVLAEPRRGHWTPQKWSQVTVTENHNSDLLEREGEAGSQRGPSKVKL